MKRAQLYGILVIAATVCKTLQKDSRDCRLEGDRNVVCEAYETNAVIPCARFLSSPEADSSYSYYVKENNTLLARAGPGTLHVAVSLGDNDRRICCRHVQRQDSAEVCFKLRILRPPTEVPLSWPPGYTNRPVVGQPFRLRCPLEGNPPLTYTWERYSTIDMKGRPLALPPALEFGEGGRSLETEIYSVQENGLYICRGSNHLGNSSYINVNDFFLNADKCSQHYKGFVNVLITGNSQGQALGSNVTLHCKATPVQKMRPGKPQWWRVRSVDGREEEEEVAGVVKYNYDGDACTWHSSLTIPSIRRELEGNYYCGLAGSKNSIAVSIKESTSTSIITWYFFLMLLSAVALWVWISHTTQASQIWWSIAQWAYEEPGAVGYQYDVFISCHVETSKLAHDCIFKGLEAWFPHGYRVCWHERDFLSGATIFQNISEAVHSSRKVVVILSKRFMESEFCRAELDLALHRMHTSRTRCLIPITLDEGYVPSELRKKITYWPLGEVSKDGAKELLRKLASLIGDPIEAKGPHIMPSCAIG